MGNTPAKEGGFFKEAPAFLQHTKTRRGPGAVMGAVFSTDPQIGGEYEGETLMCVHCQKHWIIQPGSGMQRGFCMNCDGPTCGKQSCETVCKHWEKAVEEREAEGRRIDLRGAVLL